MTLKVTTGLYVLSQVGLQDDLKDLILKALKTYTELLIIFKPRESLLILYLLVNMAKDALNRKLGSLNILKGCK